jgi:dihydroorotase
MYPPLRSDLDREAICRGIGDGTIDVIATDHAPHSFIEKKVEFDRAANGIIGLETSVSLSLNLVKKGVISLTVLVEKMSTRPARILGLENGLHIGRPADITIIDTQRSFRVNADNFRSLSRNTPFDGWDMTGKVVLTMVEGKIVYKDEDFV